MQSEKTRKSVVSQIGLSSDHFKRVEESISESISRLNKTQEIAHLGSWEFDLQQRQLTWSDEVYRIFGLYPKERQVTYELFMDHVHPDDRDKLNFEFYRSVNENKDGFDTEHRIVDMHSGEVRFVYEKCEHIRDNSGRIVRSVGMVQDITERKQTEKELQQSKEQLQLLIRGTLDYYFRLKINDDGGIYMDYLSDNFTEVTGRTFQDVSTLQNWTNFIHPDDIQKVNNSLKEAILTAKNVNLECRSFVGSTLRYVQINSVPVINKTDNQVSHILGTVRDITNLKLAENALRESQSLLSNIINSTTDIIYVKNLEGKYTLINSAAENAFGITAEEVLGKDDYALFSENEVSNILNDDRMVLEGSLPLTYEEYLSDPLGKQITYLTTKGPLVDKKGKIIGLFGIARDITKRKQIEKALIKSEEQFRTIVSNMGEGFAFVNDEETFVFVNRAGEEIFGFGPGGLVGKNLKELVSPNQYKLVQSETNQRVQGNRSVYEMEIQRPNGEVRNIIVTAVPYFEKEKKFLGTYGVFRDITERKKSERELKESEEKYRNIIEFAVDGILRGSPEGIIIDANSHFCSMIDKTRGELIGKHISSILSSDSLVKKPLRFDLLNKGEIIVNEREIIRKDGASVAIEMRTKMMPDKTYQSIFRDVSVRKKAEQKIKQQNEELVKLNSDKDLFMSIMGHDLKSPFNSLLGFSELLMENIHDFDIDKIDEIVNYINKSAQNAYNLLEDLLLWSTSQSGKIPYKPKKLNFNDICMDILSEMRLISKTKKISIGFSPPEKLYVVADPDMLRTVLRNLISNAVKFTNSGGHIDIKALKTKTNIFVSVADSGVGIPPEKLKKLFDVSQMNSSNGTDGETGTGLGLLLCNDFINKHDGTILVESEAGKGSVFTFTLPI